MMSSSIVLSKRSRLSKQNICFRFGISVIFLVMGTISMANAALQNCVSAPLIITKKNIGQATYFAQNCQNSWDTQDIRLDFNYSHDIPGWAFKRAANHFLKKNLNDSQRLSSLQKITNLYKPVKRGDLYSLSYSHQHKTLKLSLNGESLGSIQQEYANDYFKIWFGASPFDATLKQQLLNKPSK